MIRPKVGDTVRVQYSMWKSIHFADHKLEELNFCLGFYGDCEGFGPRVPTNFTPLSELVESAPGAKREYWSNYGEYFSEYVNTFEIISS